MLVKELIEKMFHCQKATIDIYKFDEDTDKVMSLFKKKTKGDILNITIPENVLNMTVKFYSIRPNICDDYVITADSYIEFPYFEVEIIFSIKVMEC